MLTAQTCPAAHLRACYEVLAKQPKHDFSRMRIPYAMEPIKQRREAGPGSQGPKASASRKAYSWADLPGPFKALMARAAGLPEAVREKVDRDLSEAEKAALRAAADRLHGLAGAVREL